VYPQISDHPVLCLFEETLSVPSPSGREEQLAGIVYDKLASWGYEPQRDAAGNVLVRVSGRESAAPLCCLAAHIDEIGMVVTRIEPDGSLKVDRSGGLFPWKLGEGPVQILGDEATITGVLSMGSGHVSAGADHAITWDRARVLTGLSTRALDAAGVRPGSPAVPVREGRGPVLFGDPGDPLVAAWTFDDRMGVVALLRTLELLKQNGRQPVRPLLVAFVSQEEINGLGAKALALRERPETFISIDGCPIPPEAPLELDGRPGIWSKDRLIHYDQGLVRALRRAAREAGTELQPAVFGHTASDASMVYAVGGAQRVACFGHVRENSHGYEVARLSVFENVIRTLFQFVTTWEG
jgi:putative aminopeptidase FrvX